MKINKKILIPVFATAMGLSAIGGISGAVAWYQYNTKVTGSWMGVSTADGGVLQTGARTRRLDHRCGDEWRPHPLPGGADDGLFVRHRRGAAGVGDRRRFRQSARHRRQHLLRHDPRHRGGHLLRAVAVRLLPADPGIRDRALPAARGVGIAI